MALNTKTKAQLYDGTQEKTGGGYAAVIDSGIKSRRSDGTGAYFRFIASPGIRTADDIEAYGQKYSLTSAQMEDLRRENDRRQQYYDRLFAGITADTSDTYIANTTPDFTDEERNALQNRRDSLKNAAGGNTSGTTAGGASESAPKTYEEYLAGKTAEASDAQKKANDYYDAAYNAAYGYLGSSRDAALEASQKYYEYAVSAAERNREAALRAAETARQRETVDAGTAYSTALATYGANAEKLAGMGLTGSGYGDYLTGRAYAAMRAETQDANARAQSARSLAESDYSSALASAEYRKLSADAEAKNAYASGLYNAEAARAQGRYEAQTTHDSTVSGYRDMLDQKNMESKETNSENYNRLRLDITSETSDTDIDSYAALYGLTDEQKKELTRIRDEKKAEENRYSLGLGETSLEMADRMYKAGEVSEDDVHKVYGATVEAALSAVTESDMPTVAKELYGYKTSGRISEEQYNRYIDYLGQTFGRSKVNKVLESLTAGGRGGRSGYFSVDDSTLQLQLNAIATGDARRKPAIGKILKFNGKKYVYTGKWVEAE